MAFPRETIYVGDPPDTDDIGDTQMPTVEEQPGHGIPNTSSLTVTDPRDGAVMHWCWASSSQRESEESIPSCDQLCRQCQTLTKQIQFFASICHGPDVTLSQRNKILTHYRSLSAVKSSAQAGCHLCALIDRTNRSLACTYRIMYWRIHPKCQFLVLTTEYNSVCLVRLNDRPCSQQLPTTLSSISKDDSKVIEQAQQWLRGCESHHIQCGRWNIHNRTSEKGRRFIPRRLVHIKATGGIIELIQLIDQPQLSDDERYLTLSHCWGGADIIRLTTASSSILQRSISISKLPKNFSDAIKITVRLGHKYICIDSLCIMQDLGSDWQRESRQMGSIYHYSHLTIAAVGSKDSHGGLFSQRRLSSFVPYQISGSDETSPCLTFDAVDSDPMPLYNRAWVVQERCLSRRVLEFGSSQLSWQCLESRASEQKPVFESYEAQHYGLNAAFHSTLCQNSTKLQKCIISIPSPELLSAGSNHWIHKWWRIVSHYSRGCLTFETDRLIAISGLCGLVEEATQATMIYGMWLPLLLTELLWFSDGPADAKTQIEAPSWSWLTAHAVGHWFSFPQRKNNYPIITEVEHRSTATLSLSAYTQENTRDDSQTLFVTSQMLRIGSEVRRDRDLNVYLFRFRDGRASELEHMEAKHERTFWDGEWYPDDHRDSASDLWAAPFVQFAYHDAFASTDYHSSTGLMLVSVNKEESVFRRAGSYSISWKDKDLDPKSAQSPDQWVEKDGRRWFGERKTFRLI